MTQQITRMEMDLTEAQRDPTGSRFHAFPVVSDLTWYRTK